jgi:hypothetical protein
VGFAQEEINAVLQALREAASARRAALALGLCRGGPGGRASAYEEGPRPFPPPPASSWPTWPGACGGWGIRRRKKRWCPAPKCEDFDGSLIPPAFRNNAMPRRFVARVWGWHGPPRPANSFSAPKSASQVPQETGGTPRASLPPRMREAKENRSVAHRHLFRPEGRSP